MPVPPPQGLVDYVLLAIVALGLLQGLRYGAIRPLNGVITLVAGVGVAAISAQTATTTLDSQWNWTGHWVEVAGESTALPAATAQLAVSDPATIGAAVGVALVFAALCLIVWGILLYVSSSLVQDMEAITLNLMSRIAGGILGVVRNAAFAGVVLAVLVPVALAGYIPELPGLLEDSAYGVMMLEFFHEWVSPWETLLPGLVETPQASSLVFHFPQLPVVAK